MKLFTKVWRTLNYKKKTAHWQFTHSEVATINYIFYNLPQFLLISIFGNFKKKNAHNTSIKNRLNLSEEKVRDISFIFTKGIKKNSN